MAKIIPYPSDSMPPTRFQRANESHIRRDTLAFCDCIDSIPDAAMETHLKGNVVLYDFVVSHG